MDLSDHQVETIRAWAECNPYISQVRLFGSRAKGTARPDSDADIAVTIVGTEGETPFAIFVGGKGEWEERLSVITGLRVRLGLYDLQSSPEIICYCQHSSELLYERTSGYLASRD